LLTFGRNILRFRGRPSSQGHPHQTKFGQRSCRLLTSSPPSPLWPLVMARREFSGVPVGGFFADGGVDPVHPAAQNFVREARRSKSVFMRATDFPQPEIGCVIFYARSDAGVSSSAAREKDSAAERIRCPLFILQACASCMSFANYRKLSSDKTPNQALLPIALWHWASMSILISVFSVRPQPRSGSGG